MPNSTTTVTFTSTHTSTQQIVSGPSQLFGIPTELLIIFVLAGSLLVYAYFRLQVKDTPVRLLWMFRNKAAKLFTAKEDLEGIFVYVRSLTGKRTTIIAKDAGLDVQIIPPKTELYLLEDRKRVGMSDELQKSLTDKGFKVTNKTDRKGKIKGYLVTREIEGKQKAFLDTALGGQNHMKLYATVEGSGQTVDLVDFGKGVDETKDSQDASGLIHEELSTAQKALKIMGEAGSSLMQSLLFLMSGIAFGGMITVLLIVLTGHLH
jgi:hypothetical protein